MKFTAFFLPWLLLPLFGQMGQSKDPLRDAAAAYQSGDVTTAIRLYQDFLKEYPDAAEIRSNLGAALVLSGRLDEAITEYKLALQKIPGNPRVRMNLALAYYKLGRFAEAIPELEHLHDVQPLEIEPALLLGDCLLENGQAPKATELLQPLESEYPGNKAVTYLLGVALLQQNRRQEAQVLLDRILGQGESAESEYLLGQSEYLRQNVVVAATHLARAIELNPKLPGAHSLYGQVLRGIGKADAAPEQFRAELAVNPYDFVSNVEIAMLLKQDGKLDEASIYLEKALQVRPADPAALLQKASIHSQQGKDDLARTELEQLVHSYPDFAEAHAALATAYYRLKRPADGDRERAAARTAHDRQPK